MTDRKHDCYNRPPYADGYKTQAFSPEWVPHRNTKDCQWSRLIKNKDAPGCVGCDRKQEATL